jgi:hypothetical protein
MEMAGIKDKDEQLREIGVLFQSQRAGQLVDLLATQQPRIAKDTAWLDKAQGLSAADMAIRRDPGLAWQGLKSSVDSLVGTTGESIRAAGLLTEAAQALSRYTEGLTKETQAQVHGAPSPAGEEERRRLNRLIFGEDSPEGGLDILKRKLWGGGGAPPIVPAPSGRDVHSPSVGPYAYHPAAPGSVSVSGAATVDHTVHVEVTLDPDLRAKIDQISLSQNFTVPLIGDGAGRMDSDAGSHRSGGIGHQCLRADDVGAAGKPAGLGVDYRACRTQRAQQSRGEPTCESARGGCLVARQARAEGREARQRRSV